MTIIDAYSERIRQAQESLTGGTSSWLRDIQGVFGSFPRPGSGPLDPSEAFGQAYRVTQRLVEVNVEYFQDLATAVRKHMTGLTSIMRDTAVTAADVASDQAEKINDAAHEQANELERAERAEARRVKKDAHDAAAAKYQDMTKVELSDELGRRDLPKTGNVEELRERLIESDLQEPK